MFNESQAKPPSHGSNPGYSTELRFDFSRDTEEGGHEEWIEEVDLVTLLQTALREHGWNSLRQEGWLVTDGGFWLKPQFVEHSHSETTMHTCTTIEVAHPQLLSQTCFEYQHSMSDESATDALSSGLVQWVQTDWKTFDDLAAQGELRHCQSMEMTFDAPPLHRRILFGPVTRAVAQAADQPAQEGHDFCPCCLFTNTTTAFISQLKSPSTFGLHLYAARAGDGEIMADCRVNGEDWPDGAQALLEYVKSWPDRGFEYRKQYVLIR